MDAIPASEAIADGSILQIAASMDRSFPNERKMLFRNILTTHLLTVLLACSYCRCSSSG